MDGLILGDNQLSGRYNHLAITDIITMTQTSHK